MPPAWNPLMSVPAFSSHLHDQHGLSVPESETRAPAKPVPGPGLAPDPQCHPASTAQARCGHAQPSPPIQADRSAYTLQYTQPECPGGSLPSLPTLCWQAAAASDTGTSASPQWPMPAPWKAQGDSPEHQEQHKAAWPRGTTAADCQKRVPSPEQSAGRSRPALT